MSKLSERAMDFAGFDAEFVDAILGDLTEERAERAARDGVLRARLWYAREIVRSAPHLVIAALRRGGRGARAVLGLIICATLLAASATAAFILLRDGPPARLVSDLADDADVILLNQQRAVRLPMRVLDERGHVLESDAVRYAWQAGAPISVSPIGVVQCTEAGDAVIRASVADVTQQLTVHCRPVAAIRTSSWVDLIAGGEPRDLPFVAVDADDKPIVELRGDFYVSDTSVAALNGMIVRPRRTGRTGVEIKIGDRKVSTQVIVHERVASFIGLRADQPHVAIPVRLARGDTLHFALPRGTYWIKYIPLHAGEGPPTIELEGPANCFPSNGLNVYRLPTDIFGNHCSASAGATLKIGHGRHGAAVVEGFVALDRS
jgi:hypothetical protein